MPPAIEPPLYPDVEVLLINWLTLQSADSGALTGARLCTDLPLIQPGTGGLWIRINRVSGETHYRFTDQPIVDVDCYSFDREKAVLAARTIQNLLLWRLRGASTPDGIVQNVTDIDGPRWIPDINQDLSRYSASYELYTRPVVTRGYPT